MRIHRGESPDFVLETASLRIGIEATEAINPDYVRAQMDDAAKEDGTVIDPSLYKWGTPRRPAQQIHEEAGQRRLSGDGWAGDSVEHEFARSVIDVVWRKHDKLHSHYRRFDRDEL